MQLRCIAVIGCSGQLPALPGLRPLSAMPLLLHTAIVVKRVAEGV